MDRIRLGWGLCRVDFLVEVEVKGKGKDRWLLEGKESNSVGRIGWIELLRSNKHLSTHADGIFNGIARKLIIYIIVLS